MAAGSGKVVVTVMVVIFALFALAWLVLFVKFSGLYMQAKMSSADVMFMELIGMYLRHSDYKTIVLCRITAVQGGVPLSTRDLESHHLAGGRVSNVVRAMIAAKRGGIELSWQEATARDLKGDDVLAEIQSALEAREERAAEEPELRHGDTGEAVSDFKPAGRVRFGERVIEVFSEGSNISEGTKVEVVKVDDDGIVVRAAEPWYDRQES